VTTTMASGAAPTPAGGTVTDGSYELTSSTFYGTLPDGGENGDFQTQRQTFIVTSAAVSSFSLVQLTARGTENESQQGTVSVSTVTTITYTPMCPAPGDGGNQGGSAKFTATSTTFTLFLSEDGGTLVRVYTKS